MNTHSETPEDFQSEIKQEPRAVVIVEPNAPERLLSAQEVAEMIAVNRVTILRLAKLGEIPTIRLSKRMVRFKPQDVRDWISSAMENGRTGT